MSLDLERIVKFFPAYDKRSSDPKKNHGIHGVELLMALKGDMGAVQFKLFTNWMLPHVAKEHDVSFLARPDATTLKVFYHPMPADLGYHSKVPRYEGQEAMGAIRYSFAESEESLKLGDSEVKVPKRVETGTVTTCEFTGGPCYYDGSTLNADRIFHVLLEEGDSGVWRELEAYYKETFLAEVKGTL